MVTGPRAVPMLLILGLLVFSNLALTEKLVELSADAVGAAPLQPAYEAISGLMDLPQDELAKLFGDYPPHLVVFFALCIFFAPWVAYATGFDQTATDIRSRHLRYLLLRVSRATVLLGRSLATLIVLGVGYALAILLLIWLLSGVDLGDHRPGFELIDVAYLVRIWFTLVLFSVPFVALLAWTNTLTARPYMALMLAIALHVGLWVTGYIGGSMLEDPSDPVSLVLFSVPFVALLAWSHALTAHRYVALALTLGVSLGLWVMGFIAEGTWLWEALDHASMLFPTAFEYSLLSDSGELLRTGLLHPLGLAVVFAGMGLWSFGRRDI
jgi:hypothetical protein